MLDPEEVSSKRVVFPCTYDMPFDFADLSGPVPWEKYAGQYSCSPYPGEYCATIYNNYNLGIVVPTQVLDWDPSWSHCTLYLGGMYDPPFALQTAAVLTGGPATSETPATSRSSSQVPAAPSSTAQPPIPTRTPNLSASPLASTTYPSPAAIPHTESKWNSDLTSPEPSTNAPSGSSAAPSVAASFGGEAAGGLIASIIGMGRGSAIPVGVRAWADRPPNRHPLQIRKKFHKMLISQRTAHCKTTLKSLSLLQVPSDSDPRYLQQPQWHT